MVVSKRVHALTKGIQTLTINLNTYGLTPERQAAANNTNPDAQLARVTAQHRDLYEVITAQGPLAARLSGKLRHSITNTTDLPTVGDWLFITAPDSDQAMIEAVLPRQSLLARGSVHHSASGQLIAANLDTIFICMSLNADFNLRRIERYLTMAWESQAQPVIVLTKADVCSDVATKLTDLETVSIGVPVLVCSATTKAGLADLWTYTKPGQTVAFIGSSGVGKSTLINYLLGEATLATKAIRADDDKGRHTTTARQLLQLPNGGIVIDTPGMRELQLYMGDVSKTFEDITALAAQCKFNDCTHTQEPGCAVQAAIAEGTLSPKRLQSYQKLQREMSYQGLNARQLEQAKIKRMFGGKNAMKQMISKYK